MSDATHGSPDEVSSETGATGTSTAPAGGNDQRYDLTDLFCEMSPETETVYKAIGIVLTLVMLGLALGYPILVCSSDTTHSDAHAVEHDATPSSTPDH